MQQETDNALPFPMKRCPFAPPPEYAELRAKAPLSKVKMSDGTPAWLVTRYKDVRSVLSDPRFSTVPSTPGYPFIAPARAALLLDDAPTFIRMDVPEHTPYRRMLTKEFMVGHIEAMRPKIQKTVDDLLDEMIKTTPPCDFVEAFALALPTTIISDMMGVPYEDREFFQERSKAKIDLSVDPSVPLKAGEEMRAYLDKMITDKMNDPGNRDDLMSRLALNQLVPGYITRKEAVAMVELLLMGGHETTANMVALGTLSLLLHPDQKDEMVADPSLVPNAVEEMLRYHTIVHYNGPRVALEDVEVGGTLIRKGEGVLALISAANRDPEEFPEPDTFNIHRQGAAHHVAFSFGVHQCLGQALARAELQVVFSTLFQRLPNLRLAVPLEEIKYKYDAFVYGVEALPVTW